MRRLLPAVIALALPALALAEFPSKLGYQGRVLRADGSPESGVVQFRFALFDAEQSGGVLWEEEQQLALSDGYYSTLLGEKAALSASLFDGRNLFLEISLGGTPVLPRHRISAVPFAMTALNATGVNGGKVVASEIWVGSNKVVDADGKLAGAAAYSAGAGLKLTGTTFSLLDSCQEGEVLHWSGGTWACAPDGGNTYTAGAGLKLSGGTFSLLDTCSAGQVLKFTGSTWACGADESGGQGATTQAPITGSGAFNNPISIPPAGPSSDGYLKTADWNAFNAKVGGVAAGAGVVVTGTTNATVAADFGSGAGKVVEGNDPRLTDKRDPKAGSADYIQNQAASAQNASFNLAGAGVAARLTATQNLVVGGTAAARETLDVNGSMLAAGVRRIAVSLPGFANPNDWADIGKVEDTGTGTFVRVTLWGHYSNVLFVNDFDVYTLMPYIGSTTDWIEVAPRGGRGWNNMGRNVSLDVRREKMDGPLLLRARQLGVASSSVSGITAVLETNGVFTATTGKGEGGTVAEGLLGAPGWMFPVSPDRFAATKEGLFVQQTGEVGIGTMSPKAKLDVAGVIQATEVNTTNAWHDLLVPTGWSQSSTDPAKCRFNNGFVEFRGRLNHPGISGWPAGTYALLPEKCRPQTVRYTEMPCHGSSPRNTVCNNDFYPNGNVMIYADQVVNQQRFDGVRIWALAN